MYGLYLYYNWTTSGLLGDWFMTIIKRCEKEVPGTWAGKQLQAAIWLDHFVPHYSGRCVSVVDRHDCPAKHTTTQDNNKRWLDGEHAADKVKIAALLGANRSNEGLTSDCTFMVTTPVQWSARTERGRCWPVSESSTG